MCEWGQVGEGLNIFWVSGHFIWVSGGRWGWVEVGGGI